MSVQGRTEWIKAPSLWGFLRSIYPGRHWTLKFKCGACGAKSIVQHNDDYNFHRCRACKEINILDYYDWYQLND